MPSLVYFLLGEAIMDNPIFDVNGSTTKSLKATLDLLSTNFNGNTFSRWHITPEHGMILYCDQAKEFDMFGPTNVDTDIVTQIAMRWLNEINYNDFIIDSRCRPIDIDGDVKRGWQVTVWHAGSGIPQSEHAVCSIRPAWIYIGK